VRGTSAALCPCMNSPRSFSLCTVLLWLLVAVPATAQDVTDPSLESPATEGETAEPRTGDRDALERELEAARGEGARDRTMEHLRFEGTLGFLGGWARYGDLGFAGTLPASAFEAGPITGAPIAGLRYDLRLVVAFVRMTVGADLAWSLYDAGETSRTFVFDEQAHTVSDRSVFSWSLRFGLGFELAASSDVRVFADLLGSLRVVEAQSAVASGTTASTQVSSQAMTFVPGLRIGARMRVVDAFFVQLAADGSPIGPWVTGELSVGGAIE
jgi:hypothetical protein